VPQVFKLLFIHNEAIRVKNYGYQKGIYRPGSPFNQTHIVYSDIQNNTHEK